MQSIHGGRALIEPALRVVFYEDQWVNRLVTTIGAYLPGYQTPSAAVSDQLLQLPCPYKGIIQPFSASEALESGQNSFLPGIVLQVEANSAVLPILAGRVILVEGDAQDYKVLIGHEQGFESEYGGLKRVLVKPGMNVTKSTVLGRNGEQLYFALNSRQGPLDPGQLFP